MPGDFNRAVLTGFLAGDPVAAGKGARLTLRSEQRWNDREGRQRCREDIFDILVMHPALVAYALTCGAGDKVMVEGTLEPRGTVILGALHSSMQLLVRAAELA